MQALRYYHYLSLAKIDMLYDQLEGGSWSSSGEVGVNALVQAKVGFARDKRQPNVYAKLARLEREITNGDPPGTASSPEPFIRDRMELWSVVVETEMEHETGSPTATMTVLYVGRDVFGTSVVLGGSTAHMGPRPRPADGMDSSFYYLQHTVSFAAREWSQLFSHDEQDDGSLYRGFDEDPEHVDGSPYDWLRDCVIHLVKLALEGDRRFTPVGYCEFLARTVRSMTSPEPSEHVDAVLATPLYVAQVEVAAKPRPMPGW